MFLCNTNIIENDIIRMYKHKEKRLSCFTSDAFISLIFENRITLIDERREVENEKRGIFTFLTPRFSCPAVTSRTLFERPLMTFFSDSKGFVMYKRVNFYRGFLMSVSEFFFFFLFLFPGYQNPRAVYTENKFLTPSGEVTWQRFHGAPLIDSPTNNSWPLPKDFPGFRAHKKKI